jgi:hypothetical protein
MDKDNQAERGEGEGEGYRSDGVDYREAALIVGGDAVDGFNRARQLMHGDDYGGDELEESRLICIEGWRGSS